MSSISRTARAFIVRPRPPAPLILLSARFFRNLPAFTRASLRHVEIRDRTFAAMLPYRTQSVRLFRVVDREDADRRAREHVRALACERFRQRSVC